MDEIDAKQLAAIAAEHDALMQIVTSLIGRLGRQDPSLVRSLEAELSARSIDPDIKRLAIDILGTAEFRE